MDCIFCKIAKNYIPSYKIYEDSDIIAILDIYPANPGHILILPKEHFQDISKLPDDITGKIFVLAKYLSIILIQALNAKGINILLSSGETAGQRIPHIIVHLIPRYENDNINFVWDRKQVSNEVLSEIQKILVYYLKNYFQPASKETESRKTDKENVDKPKEYKDYTKMIHWFYKNI